MLLLLLSRAFGAPCTASTDGLHDFSVCTDRLTWADAATACAASGAHLADVEDITEDAWLWAAVSAADPSIAWWIGLNDRATEGTFLWDGGATATYTHWRSGEPNDYARNEDCTRLPTGGGGDWADADCTLAQPYVCESGCLYESAYEDLDGDGYGDPDSLSRQCGAPAGSVSNGEDCDDLDAASSPDGSEVCGGGDEDCDGLFDGDDPDCDLTDGVVAYEDADGDGVGAGSPVRVCALGEGASAVTGDCDDADPDTFPGNAEVANDGFDQDCDGLDACASTTDGLHDFYLCAEPARWSVAQSACASLGAHLADVEDAAENTFLYDESVALNPSVSWWFGANDLTSEGTFVWDGGSSSAYTDWRSGEPNDYSRNEDCARWPAGGGGEWADADCSLSQPYVCESGCLFESAYEDLDGDGYGDPDSLSRQCGAPAGTVSNAQDCDDTDPASSPEGYEVCGGGDEDCDGLLDADDPDCDLTDGLDAYEDADGDGVGAGSPVRVCALGATASAVTGDCDDADPDNFPGNAEVANDGHDQDCDGLDACASTTDGLHDFYLCTAPATWSDAADACAAVGAHLADLEDPAENTFLYAEITAAEPGAAWWFGANDISAEGTFVWDGGSSSTYTDWRSGEPNDYGGNEDCARWPASSGGVWADSDCATAQPYVCESGCLFESAWVDGDGDGHGDPATLTRQCGAPAGTVASGDDCNDTTAGAYPGALEVCDGIDDDCDGLVDDADPDVDLSTGLTAYADADGDGYGAGAGLPVCALPEGTSALGTDCDDGSSSIHPGAPETPADGVDADCDGSDGCTVWVDADGDGYGDPASPVEDCSGSDGTATNADDCNDADADVHPGAPDEPYDGVDADCGGGSEYDLDADGFDTTSSGGTDCDDTDPLVHTGAEELCNGEDDDCDGDIDDPNEDAQHNPVATCAGCTMVSRADHTYQVCPTPTPWATAKLTCEEGGYTLADTLDEDEGRFLYTQSRALTPNDHAWLGLTDEAADSRYAWTSGAALVYTAWADGEPRVVAGTDCVRFADASTESSPTWATGDCAEAHPYICELGCAAVITYGDHDGDGYGDPADIVASCDPDPLRTTTGGDCDDSSIGVSPAAVEICDEADTDEDCDGLADDEDPDTDPAGMSTWYLDVDGDGFGDDLTAFATCDRPDGAVATAGDCDDASSFTFPGAPEALDNVDNDCDGLAETEDCDGLADCDEKPAGCGCTTEPAPNRSTWSLLVVALGVVLARRTSRRFETSRNG